MSARIDNLTGVRAFAALWVVLYHLNLMETNLSLNLGHVVEHGDLGVDVFFVLSSFVLTMVYADKLPVAYAWTGYRRFLLRRLAKIYPLHLLTLLLMIGLLRAGHALHYNLTSQAENTPWSALCSLLLVHAMGLTKSLSWNKPSWSVGAEWFAYAALFTPMVFLLRHVRTLYVAVGAAALLAAMALLSFSMGAPWTAFTTNGALRILPDFLCGYLLRRMLRGRRLRHGDAVSVAGLFMVLLACYLPFGSLWLLVPGIMTLLAGLYAGGPVVDRVAGNRLLIALGNASYSMYLLQVFVLIAAKQVVVRLHVANTVASRAVLIAGVVGSAAVAGLLCFRFVEEPLRQAVLRRFDRSARSPERMRSPVGDGSQPDTQVSGTIG